MATQDQLDIHHDNTRRYLAFFWSAVAAAFLFIVVFRWGNQPEILTLLIGFVLGGSITGAIMGTYFASNTNANNKPGVTQTADTITNQPSPTNAGTTTIVTTPAS